MLSLLHAASIFAFFPIPKVLAQDGIVVETNYGPIRGEEITSGGPHHFSFKGIPFAAPPVGDLRFAAPKPPEKWTEVRNTTKYGYICPQRNHPWRGPMSEDCLTLSVFTPSLEENSLKPVLVWIHGGGFHFGDSTDRYYGPHYLLGENIVVVSINYRLGPLGFLTENTADVSGNWGLKDQVAALKWVQENIAHFGGDPSQVTIYGESTGGVSVHLHILSPLSKGLFSKAIAASGVSITSAFVRTADHDAKYSLKLASLLGAEESDMESPEKRIKFLRTADPVEMVKQSYAVMQKEDKRPHGISLPFVAVVEAPETEGAFLTESPRKLLKEGRFTKVPMIIGVTDLEGGSAASGAGKNIPPRFRTTMEDKVCDLLPRRLEEAVQAKNECPNVAATIRRTYFGGQPFNSSLLNYVYLLGDLGVILNVHCAQRLQARHTDQNAPLYNYYFTFDGRWNSVKKYNGIALPGAAHSEELAYVFKSANAAWNIKDTSPEAVTRKRMVRLIGNFAKHGNPTPEVTDLIPVIWEPATGEESITMVIGNELALEKTFLPRRMEMWDGLFKEYTGHPLFS